MVLAHADLRRVCCKYGVWPRSEFLLCHLVAVWHWPDSWTLLKLSFMVYKMEMMTGSTVRVYGECGIKCQFSLGAQWGVLPTLSLLRVIEPRFKLRSSALKEARLGSSQWLSSPPQTSGCWLRAKGVSPQTWTRLALGPCFTAAVASGRFCPVQTDFFVSWVTF